MAIICYPESKCTCISRHNTQPRPQTELPKVLPAWTGTTHAMADGHVYSPTSASAPHAIPAQALKHPPTYQQARATPTGQLSLGLHLSSTTHIWLGSIWRGKALLRHFEACGQASAGLFSTALGSAQRRESKSVSAFAGSSSNARAAARVRLASTCCFVLGL